MPNNPYMDHRCSGHICDGIRLYFMPAAPRSQLSVVDLNQCQSGIRIVKSLHLPAQNSLTCWVLFRREHKAYFISIFSWINVSPSGGTAHRELLSWQLTFCDSMQFTLEIICVICFALHS